MNERAKTPALKTKIDGIEQYDVMFLGCPTWGMRLPPPTKSFLRHYSLKGKTVIPSNTNAGYGVRSGFETVRELGPAKHCSGRLLPRGGIERDGVWRSKEHGGRKYKKKWRVG